MNILESLVRWLFNRGMKRELIKLGEQHAQAMIASHQWRNNTLTMLFDSTLEDVIKQSSIGNVDEGNLSFYANVCKAKDMSHDEIVSYLATAYAERWGADPDAASVQFEKALSKL